MAWTLDSRLDTEACPASISGESGCPAGPECLAGQAGQLLAAAYQAVLDLELQEFNTVSVEEWDIIRPSPEDRAMQVISTHFD